jgi:hypothetical protein
VQPRFYFNEDGSLRLVPKIAIDRSHMFVLPSSFIPHPSSFKRNLPDTRVF